MQKQLRYRYVLELCNSIEKHIDECEKSNPDAFFYRAQNLRYAVEHGLFTLSLDDPVIQSLYQDYHEQNLKKAYYLDSSVKKPLVEILLSADISKKLHVKVPFKSRLKRFVLFNRLGNFIYHYSTKILLKLYGYKPKAIDGHILGYVIHEKFMRYLDPIGKKMTSPFSFMSFNQPALFKFTRSNSLFILENSFPNQAYSKHFESFPNIIALFESAYQSFSKTRPKAVIVPEGDSLYYETLNQVCKLLNIPCYCIQHGFPPIMVTSVKNMNYSKMLVWGEEFAKLLKSYSPEQSFAITGNHIVKKATFKPDNSWISFFLQATTSIISEEAWQQFLSLIKYTAKHFDYTIAVREHPSYPLTEHEKASLLACPNIKLVPASEYSLDQVLSQSILSVSIFSTTIIESLIKGVVPLIVNLTDAPHYSPDLAGKNAAVEVHSVEEAKQALHKLLDNKEQLYFYAKQMEQIKNQYCAFDGEQAIAEMVAVVES
jgi:hypothetical protein